VPARGDTRCCNLSHCCSCRPVPVAPAGAVGFASAYCTWQCHTYSPIGSAGHWRRCCEGCSVADLQLIRATERIDADRKCIHRCATAPARIGRLPLRRGKPAAGCEPQPQALASETPWLDDESGLWPARESAEMPAPREETREAASSKPAQAISLTGLAVIKLALASAARGHAPGGWAGPWPQACSKLIGTAGPSRT
jgi:hypothetical protein